MSRRVGDTRASRAHGHVVPIAILKVGGDGRGRGSGAREEFRAELLGLLIEAGIGQLPVAVIRFL